MAVHDEVSTFEINHRKKSLPRSVHILMGALSNMRPVKVKAEHRAVQQLPCHTCQINGDAARQSAPGNVPHQPAARPIARVLAACSDQQADTGPVPREANRRIGLLLEPLLFTILIYWLAGLRATMHSFLATAFITMLTINVSTACGCFFSSAFESVGLAMACLVPFDYVLMITSGLFVRLGYRDELPHRRTGCHSRKDHARIYTCARRAGITIGRWIFLHSPVPSTLPFIVAASVAEQFDCSPPTKAKWVQARGLVTPGFSQVGIVPCDTAGRRVFSGISRFTRPCISALLHSHLISPPPVFKTSLRAARTSEINSILGTPS
ncbi:hypothetical protein PR048_031880 [Dryococelus australis]|uniref:ABC-2 type transporter transmembrane domain-containing protein n=1 Tax=Dryococelus australis TaxID=614101 RepID=A0ABQ9G6K1_9NEOP|nr:hypothetical protein PR048_031880 [Dryococelus australis]